MPLRVCRYQRTPQAPLAEVAFLPVAERQETGDRQAGDEASCGIAPRGCGYPLQGQLAFGAAGSENFGRWRKRQGGACTLLDCELAGRSLHMAGHCLLQKQSPFSCARPASGGLGGCNKRLRPRNLQFGGRGVGAAGARRPASAKEASAGGISHGLLVLRAS
jgi:hypothetical protein